MSEATDFFTIAVIVAGAALVASLGARLARAPAMIGYLAAGMAIGPAGFGLVHGEQIHSLTDVALVPLLFTIGLELSPAPLLRMGARLVTATALQMGLTCAVTVAALVWLANLPWLTSLILGLAISPTSTAIVLKQLSDRGETNSPVGNVSTGILLLQDVIVVLVLIALPLFAGSADGGWGTAATKFIAAAAGFVGVAWLARAAVPMVVRVVFREPSREVMTLFAVVMAVTGAWAAGAAGWSPALGAAIAGLLLAAADVRHQLFAEITPFREVFTALFFVSLGMLVDREAVLKNPGILGLAVLACLIGKTVIAAGAIRLVGWPLRLSLGVGMGLATISEFGFVIGRQAVELGALSNELLTLLIIGAVGSMLAGAFLFPLASPISSLIARRLDKTEPSPQDSSASTDRKADMGHVIVIGYGLNGRNLTSVLSAIGIPFRVVEMNPGVAHKAKAAGIDVTLGDAARQTILEYAGLQSARAVVACINDQATTRRIVAQVRSARKDVYLLARTRSITELEPLYHLGANEVIPEEFETSIEIFAHVLHEFAVPTNVIEQQIALIRAGHYGMLRGRSPNQEVNREWLRWLETSATQTYFLLEGSPVVGRTIRDTNLRAATGVTIVAITRSGLPIGNPPADFVLAVGDVLVLVGTHRQLEAAKSLLAPPSVVREELGNH